MKFKNYQFGIIITHETEIAIIRLQFQFHRNKKQFCESFFMFFNHSEEPEK